MKYDFTSIIDRHGMDAIAVDSWGEIPGMAPNVHYSRNCQPGTVSGYD